jgi:hypothetical protein
MFSSGKSAKTLGIETDARSASSEPDHRLAKLPEPSSVSHLPLGLPFRM